MNTKGFFVATLTSAIDLGVATGDDVLRYATPEILAAHLPRPLWARLLTACVGASGVDAQLVLETIGIPNLCEHVPVGLLWRVLADIGARVVGGEEGGAAYRPPVTVVAPAPTGPSSSPAATPALLTPAPSAALLAPAPAAASPMPTATQAALPMVAPSIPAPSGPLPLAELAAEMDEDRPLPGIGRARTPTSQRFRAGSTGIGRPASTAGGTGQTRRPQAAASPAAASVIEAGTSRARRTPHDPNDYDIETDVRPGDDWRAALAPPTAVEVDVEDEQLVDWAQSEETVTGGDGINRKR